MPRRRAALSLALSLALATALAACTPPSPGVTDVEKAHPIRVEMRTFSVAVPLDRLEARPDTALPGDFVREYHRRGRGPMTIVLPDPPDPRAAAAAEHLGTWLGARLVQSAAVRAAPGVPGAEAVAGGTAVAVFFKAFVATVPECGDWSGEDGFNPTNQAAPNFGCSYQRNIGMMLSDPGDWVQAQPTAPMDASRATAVIDAYRAGEPTGVTPPTQERGALADVQATAE